MIVYSGNKTTFQQHVLENRIAEEILDAFEMVTGHKVSMNEFRAFQNSMMFMKNVLDDEDIPENAGVSIEYIVPLTSKRIDFILSGANDDGESAVIIELKQWSEAALTGLDGIVETYVGGRVREVSHPSYQAWSYAAILNDYNQTVEDEKIQLIPCAYMHNYEADDVIGNNFYKDYLEKAPVFYRHDAEKLQKFIKRFVKYGDKRNLMYRIDHGKIRPSKHLADTVLSMIKGNKEFVMIDDQKVVYERAMHLASLSNENQKNVYIVEGGPGTGKSVVAVNLLTELTGKLKNARYVTRNAAPRSVYEAMLVQSMKRSEISNLFNGSGNFIDVEENLFDTLIVDEAHRLNEKSGLYQNLGENQIEEIINAAKLSIFFIDENQKVTLRDIGDKESIRHWAKKLGATVTEDTLSSQFRCNGSDGYLAWLDNILQISDTANFRLEEVDYDFRVFDSPTEMREEITNKNHTRNKSRLVAGYCWPWISKKNPSLFDITFEEYGFNARWNLNEDGSLWIMKPNSIEEVGCIHTCQGLELDYVGVIIGDDFLVRSGQIITDATARASSDSSVKGYKTMLKNDPTSAREKADTIIKNTYRTLMTRGQKGCYIFCADEETRVYFKNMLATRTTAQKLKHRA
jgi:hypothetical protein